jgi:hypothetical protein
LLFAFFSAPWALSSELSNLSILLFGLCSQLSTLKSQHSTLGSLLSLCSCLRIYLSDLSLLANCCCFYALRLSCLYFAFDSMSVFVLRWCCACTCNCISTWWQLSSTWLSILLSTSLDRRDG